MHTKTILVVAIATLMVQAQVAVQPAHSNSVAAAAAESIAPMAVQQEKNIVEESDDAEAEALKNNSNYEEAPREASIAKPASIKEDAEKEEGPEKAENSEKEEIDNTREASVDKDAKAADQVMGNSIRGSVKPASIKPNKNGDEKEEVEVKKEKEEGAEKKENTEKEEGAEKEEKAEKEEGAEVEMSEPAGGESTETELSEEDTVEAAENDEGVEAAEDTSKVKASASASMRPSGVSSHMANASGHSLSFVGPSGGLAHASSAGAPASRPSTGNSAKVQKSNGNLVRASIGATVGAVALAVFSLV